MNNTPEQIQFDQDHEYTTYPRRFLSYKWYKPILVGLLTSTLMLMMTMLIVILILRQGYDIPRPEVGGAYDDMDVSSVRGVFINLGSLAVMIPALWIATKIVRDRPFSSYSSSRGGWNWKLFGKCMLLALVIVGIPGVISNLIIGGDGVNRFSVASFIALTILGPLQCMAEEYIFRGFLIQTIGSWVRIPIASIFIAALVFASGHPYSIAGVISVLISGLIWGFMAKITRGLEASSAAHIVNNMSVFYMMGLGMTTLSSNVSTLDMVFSVAKDIVYMLAILLIAQKLHWFDELTRDDVTPYNEKIEAK